MVHGAEEGGNVTQKAHPSLPVTLLYLSEPAQAIKLAQVDVVHDPDQDPDSCSPALPNWTVQCFLN